jgi:hypothetical protein
MSMLFLLRSALRRSNYSNGSAAQSNIRLIKPVVDNRWLTAVVRKMPPLPRPCFVECFKGFDTIVGPSGSCVHHIRCHLDAVQQTEDTRKVRTRTRELVEFLHDDLKVNEFPWAGFPHKVGLHDSCSAVRGLGHARPSELSYEPCFSKTRDLLGKVALFASATLGNGSF